MFDTQPFSSRAITDEAVWKIITQVYIQPSTAAGSVTLLAFAAALLPLAAARAAVDITCPPGPQQQSRRTMLLRSIAGTDRRTDRRTPYRYVDPAACCANSVKCKSGCNTV